jgi:large subunit ribosomal protein L12e
VCAVKHTGNLTMKDIVEIAKTMRPRSQAKTLKGTVKEILGTCVSIGCTIEGDSAKVALQKVTEGKYDNVIPQN